MLNIDIKIVAQDPDTLWSRKVQAARVERSWTEEYAKDFLKYDVVDPSTFTEYRVTPRRPEPDDKYINDVIRNLGEGGIYTYCILSLCH